MADAGALASPADLRRALRELVRAQLLRERGRAGAEGLTPAGAHALEVLAERGDLSLTALAAELRVDRSTACRTVGLLEDRGLVLRVADASDGRAIRLALTPAGRAVEARLRRGARRGRGAARIGGCTAAGSAGGGAARGGARAGGAVRAAEMGRR